MHDVRFLLAPQRPAGLVKRIASGIALTGLLAMLAITQYSPATPPRFDLDPSVADERVSAVAAVQTSQSPIEIDVEELRHQQLAIHG